MHTRSLKGVGLAIWILAVPVFAIADAASPHLINPKDSGLNVLRSDEYAITFAGRVWVSGTLQVEWPADPKESPTAATLSANIKLDKGEVDRLPHFEGDPYGDIYIENAEDALRIGFPKDTVALILGKQVQTVEIHGHFLVDKFYIDECGSPWADAHLVGAKDQGTPTVIQGLEFGDC